MQIARGDSDAEVRLEALCRLREPVLWRLRAEGKGEGKGRTGAALARTALWQAMEEKTVWWWRDLACTVKDTDTLRLIAARDPLDNVAQAALKCLDGDAVPAAVAAETRHACVRMDALRRLDFTALHGQARTDALTALRQTLAQPNEASEWAADAIRALYDSAREGAEKREAAALDGAVYYARLPNDSNLHADVHSDEDNGCHSVDDYCYHEDSHADDWSTGTGGPLDRVALALH